MMDDNGRTRRSLLAGAGIGAAAGLVLAGSADAAPMTDSEKANVKLVEDFCAAWSGKDADKLMAFFPTIPRTARRNCRRPPWDARRWPRRSPGASRWR